MVEEANRSVRSKGLKGLASAPQSGLYIARMKTLVEMSKEHFDRLLAKCSISDREYEIMKNGIITPYGESGKSPRTVVILCERAEAKLILDLARRLYPTAARQVREYSA